MRTARLGHHLRQLASLAVTAVTAATTVNAYRPLARGGFPSLYSWMFGLAVTDLPLQTLAVQLAGLAATGRRLTRPVRMLAWLATGASALGLLNLNRAGHQADVPLREALNNGLGTNRRTDSADLWRRPAGGGTAKAPGLVRMLRIYRDYAHDSDIGYGEYGRANHLDIWRRPDLDRGEKAPVLFQIPGGAWTTGNKRGQAHPLMSHLAELGWVCVAINYRHSPRNTWPDHIVDVKRALAWVKAHIAEYGGDPEFIAITGGSAGGHLSSLAALTPNDPHFQPGFEDADTRVQAAVPFYGIYDFTKFDKTLHPMMPGLLIKSIMKQRPSTHQKTFEAASPVYRVTPDAPPFFVLHGTNDSLAYVEQARTFVDRLRQVSRQPVAYAELPLTQHAFDIFGSARAAHAAVAVEQFLAEIYARRRQAAVA
ncbi:esterase [Mycobacterium sp. E2462]|uniref:alpha/beta hydrolase n=1 Tax=Mycobacterium sp. E2462 TaxID=1834133 RepID=UPI0007FC6B12|nr:alpha/beta hydrolase [Mycobacterium sp. E2462]OBI09277.1 esterase [Mycobacterium sp. E2462]